MEYKNSNNVIIQWNNSHWNEIEMTKANKTNKEIHLPELNRLFSSMTSIKEELALEIEKIYLGILGQLENQFYKDLTQISDYLSGIDVLQTKAHVAIKYQYCRPQIEIHEKSFVQAENLRHVLIEHIQTNEIYVPNDIQLGKDNCDGILLYGTNAVGKTSLIRALGISVIMAQAGIFVPCSSFVFCILKSAYWVNPLIRFTHVFE